MATGPTATPTNPAGLGCQPRGTDPAGTSGIAYAPYRHFEDGHRAFNGTLGAARHGTLGLSPATPYPSVCSGNRGKIGVFSPIDESGALS